MKKRLMIMAMVFWIAQIYSMEVPNWVNLLAPLISSIDNLEKDFYQDIQLYDEWSSRADDIQNYIQNESVVENALLCIQNTIQLLEQSVLDEQALLAEMTGFANQEVSELEQELASLESTAQDELAELLGVRNNLVTLQAQVMTAYDGIVEDATDQAQNIMGTFQTFFDTYAQMNEIKEDFLQEIANLKQLSTNYYTKIDAQLSMAQENICENLS